MADRTSAEIFGRIFALLADAKDGDPDPVLIARDIYGMTWDYDFSPGQMEADSALIALGFVEDEVGDWSMPDGEVAS